MVNLSRSASFHRCEKTAPSKPGIKHLEWCRWLQAEAVADPLCQPARHERAMLILRDRRPSGTLRAGC
jgi:hypothetical protein